MFSGRGIGALGPRGGAFEANCRFREPHRRVIVVMAHVFLHHQLPVEQGVQGGLVDPFVELVHLMNSEAPLS
jgi:hypothetical protein